MEFVKIVALRGPNIWARFPVLEAWVELGDLKDSPSNSIPGFNDRLMSWLPGMIEHRCSIGERGGFFQRLRTGTYPAHILEHITLELQSLAGVEFGFGRARETLKEGLFRVAVEYEDEALARAALEVGRKLFLAAVHDRPFNVSGAVRELRLLLDDVGLGPSTKSLFVAAAKRGIPVRRLNNGCLLQLGHCALQRRVWTAETDRTSAVAESVSRDKQLTRKLLAEVGIPVPQGRIVADPADAWQAALEIGPPVVVKPQHGNQGDGVVIGLSHREHIEAAYHAAFPFGNSVMIEQEAHGSEHRLLVVNHKLVAATRGKPALVTGDGKQTVWQLIESQINSDPRRGEDLTFPLARVERTPVVQLLLKHQGHTLDSVPASGEKLMIQRNGNLAEDVTDIVHPQVAAHAELAARVVGLDVAGIDVIAEDISRPLEEQSGMIIEVNAGPGLQMHLWPEKGQPRPVGEVIIATLFAEGETGRIPIIAVTGHAHTAEVAALVTNVLSSKARTVASTSAEGTFVGRVLTRRGDCRGADAARGVLLDPRADIAVLEVSLRSIAEEGLGFDRCLVAVATEVGEGVKLDLEEGETPAKRALVHRGLTDMVLPEGALVMKAGEPLGALIAAKSPGRLVLFATAEDDPALQEHLRAGGQAVFARSDSLVLADAQQQTILTILPSERGVETLLAAVAAAWSAGLSPEEITASLGSK